MECGSIDPGLPDIHGAIGLAAVRHVPDAFPPHEHIGNAADDRSDDIGCAVGPAGSGGDMSDVPDFRDGESCGGADLCDGGYRRDVKQRPRNNKSEAVIISTGRTRLMSREI